MRLSDTSQHYSAFQTSGKERVASLLAITLPGYNEMRCQLSSQLIMRTKWPPPQTETVQALCSGLLPLIVPWQCSHSSDLFSIPKTHCTEQQKLLLCSVMWQNKTTKKMRCNFPIEFKSVRSINKVPLYKYPCFTEWYGCQLIFPPNWNGKKSLSVFIFSPTTQIAGVI